MRVLCILFVVLALLAWRVERGADVVAYPRATMTPEGPTPTYTPATAAPTPTEPGYPPPQPYPPPHLAAEYTDMFLPLVSHR